MGVCRLLPILGVLALSLALRAEECEPNPDGQVPPQVDPAQGGDPGVAGPDAPAGPGATVTPVWIEGLLGDDGSQTVPPRPPGQGDAGGGRCVPGWWGHAWDPSDFIGPPPAPDSPADEAAAHGASYGTVGGGLAIVVTSGAFFAPGGGPRLVPIISETADGGDGSVILIVNGKTLDDLDGGGPFSLHPIWKTYCGSGGDGAGGGDGSGGGKGDQKGKGPDDGGYQPPGGGDDGSGGGTGGDGSGGGSGGEGPDGGSGAKGGDTGTDAMSDARRGVQETIDWWRKYDMEWRDMWRRLLTLGNGSASHAKFHDWWADNCCTDNPDEKKKNRDQAEKDRQMSAAYYEAAARILQDNVSPK